MKKGLFLGALASVMLLATSCQEDFPALNAGSEVTVSFNVETPQVDTRAYSDGLSATKLQYAVYEVVDSETKELQHLKALDGTANFDGKSRTTTVQLQLTKGLTYTVVFWAQNPDAKLYTVNFDETTASVEVDYNNATDVVCNNEDLDAFFGDETFTVEGSKSQNVKLNRPFAQLNIGTSDYDQAVAAGYTVANSAVTVSAKVYSEFSLVGDHKVLGEPRAVSFTSAPIPAEDEAFPVDPDNNKYLAMNYILVGAEEALIPQVTFTYSEAEGANAQTRTYGQIPVRRNYRTNIYGQLLTNNLDVNVTIDKLYVNNDKYGEEDGKTYIRVSTPEEFNEAFNSKDDEGKLVYDKIIVEENLELGADLTRAEGADPHYLVKNDLIIDLDGHKLTATSANTGKNVNWFDVNGATLTVENGTMEYKHTGDNMEWNSSTNLFNVTAGGVLNLKEVTAKNLGGSDMAFVVHLNNWGEVTLNVEDCTLESTYMAVRVFNSGPDMNNVTIKNSTLKGNKYAFWVHNYTTEDFGSEEKAEAQKKLLNLNIFNQGNKFSPDVNGILFGFTNGIACDAYGITKEVSEDGSVVTLGSVVEEGRVRRGVAGTEGNDIIKEVIVEEGVTTLINRTFRRFYALEKVTLPNTLKVIGEEGAVFQSCAKLTEVVIPESVTKLGEGTFYGCTSLVSVNVPTGVTRIEKDVFRETAIKTIEFHEGVNYFGEYAFRDCENLIEIIIKAPEFTVEKNTFQNVSGPYPTTTIYVANAKMKEYLETVGLNSAGHITVVCPTEVETAEELKAALAEGDNVVLGNDLSDVTVDNTAPYGNYYGVALNGGTLDGNGHVLDFKSSGDNYGIMTTGGTIKNATITGVFRAIMIMNPTETLYVDNVTIGDEDVCYAINTGEGDGTQSVVVSNSTIKGWSSYGNAIKDVTFKNCTFAQGSYYTNVYGRLVKPYVNAVFEGCEFNSKFYIDLSALLEGQTVTLKNCTVNGVRLTKDNLSSLVAPEDSCGEGQISIELKDGSYLTADNVVNYVIFE